jgi:hypothetical protein
MYPPLPEPSKEQQIIINDLEKYNVNIQCGPGSGKTSTALLIAKHYINTNICYMTYNANLKLEARMKCKYYDIRNMEPHSYHSFCYKWYDKQCIDDRNIHRMIANNDTDVIFNYELIIIDEAQDMTYLYYKLLQKIISDCKKPPQLCIMGDKYQCIFKTLTGSDSRYLTFSKKLFQKNNLEWKHDTLLCSFRITNEMCSFVNMAMLGYDRIKSVKTGYSSVTYHICNCYSKYVLRIVLNFINRGYKHEDIFIIAPSVKTGRTPIRTLSNNLTKMKIPVYVPCSDHEKLDNDVIAGKLTFTTFHQVKGLERKVVIIFNFDSSYFKFYDTTSDPEICPNILYVAATRAKEHVVFIHDSKFDYLPFLDQSEVKKYKIETKKLRIKNVHKREVRDLKVTDLVKFLKYDDIEKCLNYLNIDIIQGRDVQIVIPTQQKNGNIIENVSDITGTAIPAFLDYVYNKKLTIYNKKFCADKKYRCINIDKLKIQDLLYISNVWNSVQSGYTFKLEQITKYDWISKQELSDCIDRLEKYISSDARFEKSYNICNKHTNYIKLGGCVDCIDDDIIWEFKCVNQMKDEHILQLAIYMFMDKTLNVNNNRKYRLFNILTNEILEINSSLEDLNMMVKYMVWYKLNNDTINENDDDFIQTNKQDKLSNSYITKNIYNFSTSSINEIDNANEIIEVESFVRKRRRPTH